MNEDMPPGLGVGLGEWSLDAVNVVGLWPLCRDEGRGESLSPDGLETMVATRTAFFDAEQKQKRNNRKKEKERGWAVNVLIRLKFVVYGSEFAAYVKTIWPPCRTTHYLDYRWPSKSVTQSFSESA